MRFLLILFLLIATGAEAAEVEGCTAIEMTDSQGAKFTFWQHQFEEGTRDLVMAGAKNDFKRVTFDKKQLDKDQACAYQALAIAEGVNEKQRWGWHLAWADAHKIYYARMDGEAWVSSVPKKIVAKNVSEVRFAQSKDSQTKNLLTLIWQATDGAYSMQSDDEGRSWQPPEKTNDN